MITRVTLLTMCLAFLLSADAWAAPPCVVVLGFTSDHKVPEIARLSETLANDFEGYLRASQRFTVVDRRQLLNAMTRAGQVHAGQDLLSLPLSEIGALQNPELDYVVTGTLSGDAEASRVTAVFTRVLGPRAGTIGGMCSAGAFAVPYVGYLAYHLAQRAAALFPLSAQVIGVAGTEATIGAGTEQGLRVGDTLVIQEETRVVDPATGSSLGTRKREVATATIKEAQEQFCMVTLTVAPGGVKVGMTAVTAPSAVEQTPRLPGLAVMTPVTLLPAASTDGAIAGETLTNLLTNLQTGMGVQLLERPDLAQLVAEHRLAQLPVFDWAQAPEGDRLLSVDLPVVLTVSKSGAQYAVTARVDDLRTSRRLCSVTATGADVVTATSALAPLLADALRPAQLHALADTPVQYRVGFGYDVVPTAYYPWLPNVGEPLVTITLADRGTSPLWLRLTVDVPGATYAPAVDTILLTPGAPPRTISYHPPLRADQLPRTGEARPAQATVRLDLLASGAQAAATASDTHALHLLPADTWLEALGPLGLDSLAPTLAAWTANNSALDAVRGAAGKLCALQGLPGYQPDLRATGALPPRTLEDRRAYVAEQVRAVYAALQADGIRYVDQPNISFPPDRAGQRLLWPEQVLQHASANCLDGSLLFAAVLAPVLRPALVIVNGHAFVAWQTWNDPDSPWEALETTQLGTGDFATARRLGREAVVAAGLAPLFDGTKGAVPFDDSGVLGLADRPPSVALVLDVRKAREYLQAPKG